MSVFRPAARVTGPDGREWEIYAYKLTLRDRDDPAELLPPAGGGRVDAVWALVDGIWWLLLLLPRLVVRLVDVARATVAAVRSDAWTIEAISFLPRPTAYTWTTTREYRGQVVAQVEGHLARGDVPTRLTNAVYRGERRSAR
jgi:hypothetical protein